MALLFDGCIKSMLWFVVQTCNSVVYVVVMGLVLGQSLIVISTTSSLLYANLYNVLWECIVVVYT